MPTASSASEIHPRWIVELPDDLDALRAGWRKTSNNLFRSLKKADQAGLQFREARLQPRPAQRSQPVHGGDAEAPLAAAHAAPAAPRAGPAGAGNHEDVHRVPRGGHDVAAGVYHVFGDTIELVYNGSDEDALALRPNHFLYWEVMRWAAAHGLRRIDLGRRVRRTRRSPASSSSGARHLTRASGSTTAPAERGPARSRSRRSGTEPRAQRAASWTSAWRHVPAPAAARGRTRRVPVRMSSARGPGRPGRGPALGRIRARASALDRVPARCLGPRSCAAHTASSRATSRSRTSGAPCVACCPCSTRRASCRTRACARCRCSRRAARWATRARTRWR